ncbi:hypothetical protein E3U43_014398 [Larimichthys crocea]|uniref:Uncharacterized protein n=1 Tax=Larimichthys crocea TaxID=215358 RepID=A0ACD3QQ55_LARCR|nr:hypothetical protein E3U43_014398 [Larimichthys crocea]
MTDWFTSSLIATATTAATNQLLHEPSVAAGPPGMLLRVNVGWTDAEEISKKLSLLNGKDWPLKHNRYTSLQRQTKREEEKKIITGSILCCQCIVDRRKSVRTATL